MSSLALHGAADCKQWRWSAVKLVFLGIEVAIIGYILGGLSVVAYAQDAPKLLADLVERQQFRTAIDLLEESPEIDAEQADGMTALHWAVLHGHLALVERLLEEQANANHCNRYGVSPLATACLVGADEIVRKLLDAGADVESRLGGGETPLMIAARTGRAGVIRALIEKGATLEAQDSQGQNALMWAAAAGNLDAVEELLTAGAQYDVELPSGFSPFFFAVRQGHADVALRFLQAGIDVNEAMHVRRRANQGPPLGTTAILLAVENGHFELALRLLEAGADPNESRAGYTPLHAMTWVRKPLRGDGDPPPQGSGTVSSLECVRELLRRGADVDARHGKQTAPRGRLNKTDATPFLLAAESGDLPLLQLLAESGADCKLTNIDGCTPLLAASGVGILSDGDESAGTEEEAIACVKWLVTGGADINAVDAKGNSAMHGAAYKSWPALVRVLQALGADPVIWNHRNAFGRTPLEIAEGYRPGNFRPSPETYRAIQEALSHAP